MVNSPNKSLEEAPIEGFLLDLEEEPTIFYKSGNEEENSDFIQWWPY